MMSVVKTKPISKLFYDFFEFCSSDSILDSAKTKITDFTRKRVFSVCDLICFLMFRNQRTTNRDLSIFFSRSNRLEECVSKQAIHQALKKVNPEVFIKLFSDFASRFYKSKIVKVLKGYILLAIDGTSLEIPRSIENIKAYGFHVNQVIKTEDDVKRVTAQSGGIYDVLNGIFLDFQIKPGEFAELPLAFIHLTRIKEILFGRKMILLADRCYPSIELIAFLVSNGFNYCMRAQNSVYKAQVQKVEKEGWITIELTDAWLKKFKYDPSTKEYANKHREFKIRVVKRKYTYTDPKGEEKESELIYFTNLSEKEFTYDDIVALYSMRWDIETTYRVLKITEELERLNTAKTSVIECKVYAKVLYFNLMGIISKEIDYTLKDKKTEKHIHGFKVNHEIIYQMIHENLYELFVKPRLKQLELKIKSIVQGANKKIIPIRPDRHYHRWGRFVVTYSYLTFRLDGRNHPKVKSTKGNMMTVRH